MKCYGDSQEMDHQEMHMDAAPQAQSRILYIYPGVVPPELEPSRNKHVFLSRYLSGDVLLPLWWKSWEELETRLGISRGGNFVIGNFRYHFIPFFRYPPLIRTFVKFWFYLSSGLSIYFRGRKYDVVISYGSNTSGIAGLLIHWITGAKFVLEVPGVPNKIFQYDEKKPGFLAAIKQHISDAVLSCLLPFTNHLKLLFPEQVNAYPRAKNIPRSIFHEFVPVTSLPSGPARLDTAEPFFLFLGYPWFLKGVDVLINAFQLISSEFPNVSLKIVGACVDRQPYETLRAGNERIEFFAGVKYQEAMDLMRQSYAFILPSRTEAMGRVLIEAMAMSKPVIASRVDGIPFYIKDGENGLLFEPENEKDLATKMRRLLKEEKLAESLGSQGEKVARECFNEDVYSDNFRAMVVDVTTAQ